MKFLSAEIYRCGEGVCVCVLPGVQYRDGALGEDAADDDGLPQGAGSRLTQRDQDSCRTQITHSLITADQFVKRRYVRCFFP